MARSWHYPRWRRVAMQLSLLGTFGLSLGLAGALVRHKSQAAAIELSGPRLITLWGGAKASVRMPTGWAVAYDGQMHPEDAKRFGKRDPRPLFNVDEPATGEDGGRQLRASCQWMDWDRLPEVYLDGSEAVRASGEAARDPAGWHGRMDVAHSDGIWRVLRTASGEREYMAVGLVPAVGGGGWEVTVVLTCPPVGDPIDDRGVLAEVARGVTVLPPLATAPSAR